MAMSELPTIESDGISSRSQPTPIGPLWAATQGACRCNGCWIKRHEQSIRVDAKRTPSLKLRESVLRKDCESMPAYKFVAVLSRQH